MLLTGLLLGTGEQAIGAKPSWGSNQLGAPSQGGTWNMYFRACSCQGQGVGLFAHLLPVGLVPSLPCSWAECALMAGELSGRDIDVAAQIRARAVKQ